MSDAGVTVTVRADRGHINLRGNAADAAFVDAVAKACASDLPGALRSLGDDELRIYWLGPDEWSLCTSASRVAGLLAALGSAAAGLHMTYNDLSGTFVTLRLSGDKVRELLAKGCTLDLHPAVFADAACAQTGLAKAGVLLALHEGDFTLIVRRSFADYLLQWLRSAGDEYGIEFA